MNFGVKTESGQVLLGRFKSRLPQQLELDAVARLLPNKDLSSMVLLDIGMPNPVMSALLREKGGVWVSVSKSPEEAIEASNFFGTDITCVGADGSIPFEQHSFDILVVALDTLVSMKDPHNFIKECNRVIKSVGQLIITTQNRKSHSFINTMRKRIGALFAESTQNCGYSESELFQFLKTGFDVMSVSTYSRFFVEVVRLYEYKLTARGFDEETVCSKVKWLYKVADQFDFLFLGTKGHIVTTQARRRQWRERTVPTLSDGRSMHEAVLKHT